MSKYKSGSVDDYVIEEELKNNAGISYNALF
jgi:hypothetical protein